MKKTTVIAGMLLSLLMGCGRACAGPLRIALLTDTTVAGDTIFLVHLLPADVPRAIHERAEGVALGQAPELGTARTLSRESIASFLASAGFSPAQFVVPEAVVVHREAAVLTRDKLWMALRAATSRRGVTLPPDLRAEELEWTAPLEMPEEDAQLEVQEVSFDPLLQQTRFHLRVAGNPKAPSFSVGFFRKLPGETGLLGREQAGKNGVAGPGSSAELVSLRRLATLHLHSQNSFATLQVRPLEAGALGQVIRVRVPSNGHTLRARVAGPDALDAVF